MMMKGVFIFKGSFLTVDLLSKIKETHYISIFKTILTLASEPVRQCRSLATSSGNLSRSRKPFRLVHVNGNARASSQHRTRQKNYQPTNDSRVVLRFT